MKQSYGQDFYSAGMKSLVEEQKWIHHVHIRAHASCLITSATSHGNSPITDSISYFFLSEGSH